jgi:molybdopterin synthase catalytic subunit
MEAFVQLTRERLDRDALIAQVAHASVGGIVIFEGVVRDHARGKQIRYLEYDAYPEMAEQQIRAIVTGAGAWSAWPSRTALDAWRSARPA